LLFFYCCQHHKVDDIFYKNSQNPQPNQPNQSGEASATESTANDSADGSGKVVDGEYEVKDDKKS
jgi:hypothetical protein